MANIYKCLLDVLIFFNWYKTQSKTLQITTLIQLHLLVKETLGLRNMYSRWDKRFSKYYLQVQVSQPPGEFKGDILSWVLIWHTFSTSLSDFSLSFCSVLLIIQLRSVLICVFLLILFLEIIHGAFPLSILHFQADGKKA